MIFVYYKDENLPLRIPTGFMPSENAAASDCKVYKPLINRDGHEVFIQPLHWCEMEVALYFQLSISIQLLLFQCRTQGFFFLSRPGTQLIVFGVLAQLIALGISLGGGNALVKAALPGDLCGYIIAYSVVFAVLLDTVKIYAFAATADERHMKHLPKLHLRSAMSRNYAWLMHVVDHLRHHDAHTIPNAAESVDNAHNEDHVAKAQSLQTKRVQPVLQRPSRLDSPKVKPCGPARRRVGLHW